MKEEYEKAILDYNQAVQLDPKCVTCFLWRGKAYQTKKEFNKALQDYNQAIRLDPKDIDANNDLGWLLATCPIDTARDGKRAVELATTVCKLSNWKNSNYLDTLASAKAE